MLMRLFSAPRSMSRRGHTTALDPMIGVSTSCVTTRARCRSRAQDSLFSSNSALDSAIAAGELADEYTDADGKWAADVLDIGASASEQGRSSTAADDKHGRGSRRRHLSAERSRSRVLNPKHAASSGLGPHGGGHHSRRPSLPLRNAAARSHSRAIANAGSNPDCGRR